MSSGPARQAVLAPARAPESQAGALRRRYPPRPPAGTWPRTRLPRADLDRLLAVAPFTAPGQIGERNRRRGTSIILDWLETQPGATWQQRWLASGAGEDGRADWRTFPARWHAARQPPPPGWDARTIPAGLLSLICADVIRPAIPWLLTTATPVRLAAGMARTRDPAGFTGLTARCDASPVGETTTAVALHRVAVILAAKGGTVAGITIGDCLELLDAAAAVFSIHRYKSPYFYQLLHAAEVLGSPAAPTVRSLSPDRRLSASELIGRCGIQCQAVRDLLTGYLRERQASVDYVTLVSQADTLGRLFWADLEAHHPGISSLRLDPSAAAAWKHRILSKTTRRRQPDGSLAEIASPRESASNRLTTVRSFYLDIAQWAMDDPARWGPWAAPCPVKAGEIPHKKTAARRKSRMDQRTRERLPLLPALITATGSQRTAAAERLAAAKAAAPGTVFTAGGQTLRRVITARAQTASVWAEDPTSGPRRNLTREEHHAFWAWAAAEVLRMTGIRVEELTELTHHSLVQYRLPATGELIPLLHIIPSKTDTERLLVVSPELADVLSAIICRIRDDTGAVPLAVTYDYYERLYSPPMPVLFQNRVGIENRQIGTKAIRRLLDTALAASGLTGTAGQSLRLSPHDFRRIFITDAVMNGMPPHIAQLIAGHANINTTMGYKAVYPEESINGHRAYLARRRTLRPSQEYRIPTDAEWEEFLGHFQRRKVALGDCGRAYGTSCIHEHSCIRCPLLRTDPAQRTRLASIRDNLLARIEEAQREGWPGEAEGLNVSLAAAQHKLTQLDDLAKRRATIHLGMPAFSTIASHTITTPAKPAP
ncbi:MAG: tyrosine-type recombinase/integrase [Streptosporangiaceae bacterium]